MKKANVDQFFRDLYKNFNERNIEPIIASMTDDVKWANGMEGGYVYGHHGVREYWNRQFTIVNPKVQPISIEVTDDLIKINVHQVVHDLNGELLLDKNVRHIFRLKDGKVAEFEIDES